MKFALTEDSRIGQRRTNQDRYGHRESRDALLMVVADGMGGHRNGEIAAQVATDFLLDAFSRQALPRLSDPFLFLSRGLQDAHLEISRISEARGFDESPRTTLVACVVQDGIAYWAHAGDARLYLLRDGRIHSRTRDHTRVGQLVDQGLLDPDKARDHPDRSKVFSCLGGSLAPQIDYSHKIALMPGDTLALCTDGLWGPLSDATLTDTLSRLTPMDAVPELLDTAETEGGAEGDNLTLMVMRWQDAPIAGAVAESPSDDDILRAIADVRGRQSLAS